MVRAIVARCKICKLKFKKLQSQKMSTLPVERLKAKPAISKHWVGLFRTF